MNEKPTYDCVITGDDVCDALDSLRDWDVAPDLRKMLGRVKLNPETKFRVLMQEIDE